METRTSVADSAKIRPVGIIRTPFGEKFGIPRQSGLIEQAQGEVQLIPPFDDPATLDGLQAFSHVWLLFQFSACVEQGWRPRVRPPRLGGNAEVGVFASRAPFRPNALGLSAVRLLDVVFEPRPLIRVGGVDLLDGTPIFDIKPYLPYADAIVDARGGFAERAPQASLAVRFLASALDDLRALPDPDHIRELVTQVLALDPRPAYRRGAEPERVYGMQLAGVDVRWRVTVDGAEVVALCRAPGAQD